MRLLFLPPLVAALACSSTPEHSPYAANDCTGACQTEVGAGGPSGDGGSGSVFTDGGTFVPEDAGTFSQCTTDPTTGGTTCLASLLCPSVTIDAVAYAGCGYLPGATLDVECVCGNFLCPITVGTSCTQLTEALTNNVSSQDFCDQAAQVSGSACRTAVATGAGGGGSTTCDQTCLAACGTGPNCDNLCGCTATPTP